MVSGLLMELEDHNCWTIAEAAGHRGPHRLQHFLSRAVWDDQRVLDIASAWAVSHLDDGDAECLRRNNTMITTNYSCRINEALSCGVRASTSSYPVWVRA